MTNVMLKKTGGYGKAILAVGAIAVVGAVAWGFGSGTIAPWLSSSTGLNFESGQSMGGVPLEGADSQVVVINDNVGDGATVTVDVYDVEASSQTEVLAMPLAVFKADGTKLKDVSSFTSATTVANVKVGESISFAGGNSSFYVDAPTDLFVISGVQETVVLNGHQIAGESSMAVTCYDDTGSTALTANGNTTHADYQMALGTGQSKKMFCKLANNDDYSLFQLGAICTGTMNTTKSIKPTGSEWEAVAVPDGLAEDINYWTSDTSALATDGEYDACYRRTSALPLKAWDDTGNIPFEVKAEAGKDPTADSKNMGVILFVDSAWAEGADGKMYFDFFQHDDSKDVNTVGMAETDNSPIGKQVGTVIDFS